jgi:hypothetical protein
VYGLAGYRTPWWGLMPWVGFQYYRIGVQDPYPATAVFWLGVNMRPTPHTVLKAQLTDGRFTTHVDFQDPNARYRVLDLQLAWSF